jgi:hypothetical protein
MSQAIDTVITLKILTKLVKPFNKSEAFKLGVIDEDGKVLVKPKDRSNAQNDAYTSLDRLVFSLKRLLAKIPGGSSTLASLTAAYLLIKEAHEKDAEINEDRALFILELAESSALKFAREKALVKDILEDIANVAGNAVCTDNAPMPITKKIIRRKPKVTKNEPINL